MVKAKVKEWAGSYRIEAEQNKDEAKDRLLKKVIIKESGALQMWECIKPKFPIRCCSVCRIKQTVN